MRSLANDGSIIIKPTAKGCRVVAWDRDNYLDEGYNQLSGTSTYVEVKKYNDELLSQLSEKSNKSFKRLYNNKFISEKELIHFSYKFKNTSCLGKKYLLPKGQKAGTPLKLGDGSSLKYHLHLIFLLNAPK